MSLIENTKEVYFYKYCPLCEHHKKPETEHPCWLCLESGYNFDSHKPTHFKEKEKETKKNGIWIRKRERKTWY